MLLLFQHSLSFSDILLLIELIDLVHFTVIIYSDRYEYLYLSNFRSESCFLLINSAELEVGLKS